MKPPAPLSKAIQWLALAGGFLRRIPRQILGNISWQKPRWLGQTSQSWDGLQRAYPRLIGPAIIAIFLISCAGAWTWNWYSHLPKPHRVTARIEPIPVTKLEKDLKFPQLNIHFSDHAARLEDLKKPLVQGVRIEPPIAGAWHWGFDDMLVFVPTEDWPADQKLRIIFDKKFFPSHVLMERLVYETQTPRFEAAIKQLELYQDPVNPTQRAITATIELTHAVEPGELDRHLQFTSVGGSNIFATNDPAPHFTITYGLHRRVAFVRSSPITLPERDDFVKLILSKGVRTAQGDAQTKSSADQKLQLSSIASMFKIDSIQTTIARNKNGEPQQLIVLSTTADINTRDLAKALEIQLLPKRKASEEEKEAEVDSSEETEEATPTPTASPDESESSDEEVGSQLKETELWKSAADVPDEILDKARPVSFVTLPSEKAQDRQHAFRIRVETDGELYVRVKKGVRAFGDYPLSEDYNAVVNVPSLPREVQIEGQGGVLALNGEKKLSIRSRALSAIEFEIDRVATTQINHLVSQTEGKFESPLFEIPHYFNEENISRIVTERQGIALENKWKANYSAFDFSEHLRKPADGGSERGLFFLTAQGWDPILKRTLEVRDSRFVLVTDIGILTKKNADGSHDIYLMSIKQG